MTDDKKTLPPDEEYQFPQEEYVVQDTAADATAHADTASAPRSPFAMIKDRLSHLPFLKNKRILIVILIVIAAIIILRIVDANKTPAPLPIMQSHPIVEEQLVAQPDNATIGSLDTLKERTASQLRDLRTQIASVQESLSQTQTENQQMRDSLKTLADQMQILTQRLNNLAIKKIPEGARITYHLRAILPDRAWITSNTGETQSVTMGDHITQYGTVRSINVEQGIIETSSGRKIQYGPNDH